MAVFDYGVGGNEVKVDANESIADIPSNRTLLVQKLTDDAPISQKQLTTFKQWKMSLHILSQLLNLKCKTKMGKTLQKR